ncbi:MAG TPA: DNA alkylation repair protein [Fibrobacteraceae bacterium]|nr:DNA alkylation repair protein [Fibrobacteraceae bacterium]
MNLLTAFRKASNEEEAKGMRRYMREQFDFFGVKTPIRREISLEIFTKHPCQDATELEQVVKELWQQPFREMQYAACDLLYDSRSLLAARHLAFLRHLIITRSWWDTVDSLAARSLGDLTLRYSQVRAAMDKWIRDPNLWIRRSALLYQLKFREHTDWDRLRHYCEQTTQEEDFFIRKAIGWALREYAKINPAEVKHFVSTQEFSSLTVREATKNF